MAFHSYEFIFLFLPIVLLGCFLCKKIVKRWFPKLPKNHILGIFLILASLIFYGWFAPKGVPLLIGSMAMNYLLGWLMGRRTGKRELLLFGILINLGVLALTKYTPVSFVPAAISFYSFTQIAYLLECYRGNIKKVGLLEYSFYVTFFPKLMQGPIALPGEILSQYNKLGKKVNWERIYRSLYLFVLGLFKKVLIADTFGRAVDYGYANLAQIYTGDALLLILFFTIQLYFDFSGYCDMAMGIAGLLGIELPLNFNSPYKAENIIDFWKRWHITLTGFFTKYLYIPLGGNRKGKYRTLLNCMLVFLISGIWHGAGWQFIVWGAMHGVLYVITKVWQDKRKAALRSRESKCRKGLKVCLTFLYVNVAWVFFRAPSLTDAFAVFKTIGRLEFKRINWELAGYFNLDEFWYVIKVLRVDSWQYAHYILMALITIAVLVLVFLGENAVTHVKKVRANWWNMLLMVILLVWSVISLSQVSSFIYVNF